MRQVYLSAARNKQKISPSMILWLTAVVLLTALQACTTVQKVGERKSTESPKGPTPYKLTFPLGLDPEAAIIPADNPLTEEKIELGKRLYFETRLSIDSSLSCASCHIPANGFADPRQFSVGVGGKKGTRQSPTLINRVFSTAQFWDGRAGTLEEQALGPVHNPVEMAMPDPKIVEERLKADPEYVALFKAAYPPDGDITEQNMSKAIACFERTILSGNSPFDRFMAGDKTAMSEPAQRGYQIFKDEKKGNCETCHVNFNFTDENYNNLGSGMTAKNPDLGHYLVSKLEGHKGAFKTPTLREVANTAPYMHDGSEKTLEEVVDLYEKGGKPNRWLSAKMKPIHLTRQDKLDLVEFLKALSGDVTWYGKGQKERTAATRGQS